MESFSSKQILYTFYELDQPTKEEINIVKNNNKVIFSSNESRDYFAIDTLVRTCYKDMKSCNKALFKIHDYQKNSARKKKFSCQTRLLGLEANLIMAMNSNFKRKEAKSIIDAIKKYC